MLIIEMRKQNILYGWLAILTATVFLTTAPKAQADEIVISPFINVPGLTLDTPFPFPKPKSPSDFTTLNFDTSSLVLSNQPLSPLQNLIAPPLVIESTSSASLTPSPTPTPKPQIIVPAKTSDPVPSPTPTPSLTPTPTSTPTSTQVALSTPGGLNADVLFNLVNNYRAAHNLPAFIKDDKSCALALSRAPEVGAEIAGGYMHQGLRNRNLPYWNTENIITMRTEQEAFNWWINDAIHREAILGDYKYSCLACSGNSCAEEFTNYQPK